MTQSWINLNDLIWLAPLIGFILFLWALSLSALSQANIGKPNYRLRVFGLIYLGFVCGGGLLLSAIMGQIMGQPKALIYCATALSLSWILTGIYLRHCIKKLIQDFELRKMSALEQ